MKWNGCATNLVDKRAQVLQVPCKCLRLPEKKVLSLGHVVKQLILILASQRFKREAKRIEGPSLLGRAVWHRGRKDLERAASVN
jgi:hypothetical protein